MSRSNDRTSRTRRPASLVAEAETRVAECGLVVLVVALLLGAALISATPNQERMPTTTVRVGSGDTLWSLAHRYPVDGLTTGQTVELLSEINKLQDATIVTGAILRVPARTAPEGVAMR